MLCYIDVSCVMRIGQMSERSKETVLKTVEGQPSASSNLALSASGFQAMDCMEPFFMFGTLVFRRLHLVSRCA